MPRISYTYSRFVNSWKVVKPGFSLNFLPDAWGDYPI